MFTAQEAFDQVRSKLDAFGTDRYRDDVHLVPAANDALNWFVQIMQSVIEDTRQSAFSISELIKVSAWQASPYARIYIDTDALGYEVVGILQVSPQPETWPVVPSIIPATPPSNVAFSAYRGNDYVRDQDGINYRSVAITGTPYAAKRWSIEEWSDMLRNPYMQGSPLAAPALRTYAYRVISDFRPETGGYTPGGPEIEISPREEVANKIVALTMVKHPDAVVNASSQIELPRSMMKLFVEKTANNVSVRQGDGTNLYQVSAQEVAQMMSTFA